MSYLLSLFTFNKQLVNIKDETSLTSIITNDKSIHSGFRLIGIGSCSKKIPISRKTLYQKIFSSVFFSVEIFCIICWKYLWFRLIGIRIKAIYISIHASRSRSYSWKTLPKTSWKCTGSIKQAVRCWIAGLEHAKQTLFSLIKHLIMNFKA